MKNSKNNKIAQKSIFFTLMACVCCVISSFAQESKLSQVVYLQNETYNSDKTIYASKAIYRTSTEHFNATEKASESITPEGLNSDPSALIATSTRECLRDWRGCDWRGATQATYNVRPDGTWEFSVVYCCGYGRCYKNGSGASTAPGAIYHEEYSLSKDGQCLELVNRIPFSYHNL